MSALAKQAKTRAVALLAVQALLVLSIAGKYLYERKVCPRVWVRTAQFDPSTPLRGRYLAMRLVADGCSLPKDEEHHTGPIEGAVPPDNGYDRWTVRLTAYQGKLTAALAADGDRPETTQELTLWAGQPCDLAVLSDVADFFIPDSAKAPLPLAKAQQLWVEVTVPPLGPPRPIQLALSDGRSFTPINFDRQAGK